MKKSFKKWIVGLCVTGVVAGSLCCFNNYSKASDVAKKDTIVDDSSKSNEEKVKDTINALIGYFHNEEYDKVLEAFGEYGDGSLTNELLKEIREVCFNKELFEEIANITVTQVGEAYSTVVTTKEKYRYQTVRISISKDYKIMGIGRGTTLPIPEESEYFTEESIEVGSLEEYQLSGLLTLPVNNDNPPVVILVHGSGAHDADESMGSNRMFAEIAHGLAKQGIATVRYNERFNQYSYLATLDVDGDGIPDMQNSVYTEAIDDAVSIVDQISKDSRIDSNNIYIVGHSLGGMVAPKIAELNPKVKGIISLAGTPRSLIDIGDDQGELQIADMKDKSEYEKLKLWYEMLESNDNVRKLMEGGSDIVNGCTKDYWLSVNNLNVESSLKKLNIPMLILQGEDDVQVYVDKDYKEWQRILGERNICEFKLYDGLNHMFMKSLGYSINNITQEYMVPSHVDKRVIYDMADFVNRYSM